MSTAEFTSRLRERWPTETLIARGAVAIGLFAFVVALPPFRARAPWVPILVGLVAIAAGI